MADNGPDFGKSKFFKDLVEQLGLDIKDVPLHVTDGRVVPPPRPTVAQVNKLFAETRRLDDRVKKLEIDNMKLSKDRARLERQVTEQKDLWNECVDKMMNDFLLNDSPTNDLKELHDAWQAHSNVLAEQRDEAIDEVQYLGRQTDSLLTTVQNLYNISKRRKLKVASVAASIKDHIKDGNTSVAAALCDYLINMTYTKED
jgi:chromosome segregation ATPase